MREWKHMENREKAFFADENELPDDIDCLFHFLQPVEPPQALIQHILSQTQVSYTYDYSAMPAPQRRQPRLANGLLEQLVIMPLDELDTRQLRRNLC